MTVISDQAPPGQDWLVRQIRDLQRQVRELAAARTLEAAAIGSGGITIRDGAVRVLDSGGAPVAQLGRLPDGGYGLAAIAPSGQLVTLSSLAFGPVAASDPASGTRTSSAFGDLTGAAVGPSVTVTIGSTGRALAFWSAGWGITGTWEALSTGGISVELSGANTIPASSDYSLGHYLEHPVAPATGNSLVSASFQAGMMHFFKNLTAGPTTFTLKYRNRRNAGNVLFDTREIAVFPF
ncbi:hypothetical protein AB0M91_09395 [Micromonospora rifamycinica]|uniref:hypothetical protein n=1 Tax=Micromonospora rifamycinica TaxID=291594 RepID=UPI00344814D1